MTKAEQKEMPILSLYKNMWRGSERILKIKSFLPSAAPFAIQN
jgi:hypothetical protein